MNPRSVFLSRATQSVVLLAMSLALLGEGLAQSGPRIFFGATGSADENAGTLHIPVYRIWNEWEEVRVSFTTVAGTATPGEDYLDASGELVFLPHESLRFIEIPILDDEIRAAVGTFNVVISAGPEVGILSGNTRTITIEDNDGPGEFAFREDFSGAWERQAYTEIEVIRSKGRVGTVEVFFHIEGGSLGAGSDYIEPNGVLVFEPGVMQQKIRIDLLDDDLFETDSILKIHLDEASNGGVLGQKETHTLRINDSDPEPAFWFSAGRSTVREGADYHGIRVSRRGMAEQAWRIGYVVKSGTATGSSDFEPVSGVLEFEPSTTEATIYVPIVNDDEVERDESFTVELTNPENYFWIEDAISRTPPHTATIIDEDTIYPPGPANYRGIVERDEYYPGAAYGAITITIRRNGTFTGAVRLRGSSFPFRGKLVSGGLRAIVDMRNPRHPTAIVTIEKYDETRVEGKVSWGPWPAVKFVAERAKDGSKDAPVAEAGRYTAGSGSALEVRASGKAWLRGFAPDGRPTTQSGFLDRNGRISFLTPRARTWKGANIYESEALIYEVNRGGPLNCIMVDPMTYRSFVFWAGNAYVPPAAGRALSDFDGTNGAGAFWSGSASEATWSAKKQVVRSSSGAARWILTVDPETGLCRGTVFTAQSDRYRLRGACIQQPGPLDDFIVGRIRYRTGMAHFSISPAVR